MVTRVTYQTNLAGLQSLSFMRPREIKVNVTDIKPQTVMYPFFDGKDISQYCKPNGGNMGNPLISDTNGALGFSFFLPGGKFNTGDRELIVQDSPIYNIANIPGMDLGKASARYSSNGMLYSYQQTITSTTTVTKLNKVPRYIIPAPPPVNRWSKDPLAQSFFTYGITGGCFIQGIDLYFYTKDTTIPVTVEIRELINGYPGPTLVSKYSRKSLNPADVATSATSSIKTTFNFPGPVYLAEDREYCFVVLSNSNKYNLWTSKLGDKSVESGRTIYEQPHAGSMFKSENNSTWTAYQTEDIKFSITQLIFNTGEFTASFKANAAATLLDGSMFSVTSGSSVVTVRMHFQHAFKTGDVFNMIAQDGCTYRGIPAAILSNVDGFTVTPIDEYSFSFNCGSNATSTGTFDASGILNAVHIESGGTGYVSPTLTFSGGSGTGAAAIANVVGGVITSVTITNPGSGYLNPPSLVVSDASGSGADLTAISEGIFTAYVNRKFQEVRPVLTTIKPTGTDIVTTTRTASEDYVIGEAELTPINSNTRQTKLAAVLNEKTRSLKLGSANSIQMDVRLDTGNPNISPMIDLNEPTRIQLRNYVVNSNSNASSEINPTSGTAHSRYISNIITLETPSKGVRVFVTAASVAETSFDVFIRTSLSSSSVNHRSGNWIPLTCNKDRNLSKSVDEFLEYDFYKDNMDQFDSYDIKIVLYSENKYKIPSIKNYRCIILAT